MHGEVKTVANPRRREQLAECFIGACLRTDLQRATEYFRREAGVVWCPIDPERKLPDPKSETGEWRIVCDHQYTIWCMKP